MRTRLLDNNDLPRSIPIVASNHRLAAAYPSEGESHQVAVEAPAAQAPAVRAALLDLDRQAKATTGFAADGPAQIRESAEHRVQLLDVPIPTTPDTPQARQTLTTLVPRTVARVPGAQVAVGGAVASVEFSQSLSTRLPWVFGFVLTLMFVLMLRAFRSVVVAVTAIVLNMLSVAAAYGLLVLVFQYHWAEGVLGCTSDGAIVAWIPLFLFVVLFGLSMDYHVFGVSRIREAALRGMPTRDAVRQGITSSAGPVTSAAVVMVAVFSIFGTLSTLDVKQLGVGLGAAMLLDATIVRAVLLPAAMTLLGRWNWWAPPFLRGRSRRQVGTAVQHEQVPVGAGTH
jgi:RND superfamily putative drug exporter